MCIMLTIISDQKTLEPTLRSLYRSTFSTSTVPTNSHFAADLIISAPHVPCQVSIAELLGLPLHILSSTSIAALKPETKADQYLANPCSPTIILPHSGAIVQRSNTNASLTNYLSYPIYENQYVCFLSEYIVIADDFIGFGTPLEGSSTSFASPAWVYQLSPRWRGQVFWID